MSINYKIYQLTNSSDSLAEEIDDVSKINSLGKSGNRDFIMLPKGDFQDAFEKYLSAYTR